MLCFCVCLRIVVSNTYCVVYLFLFTSSGVHYVVSFSSSSILIAPSAFSNIISYIGFRQVIRAHITCLCFIFPEPKARKYTTQTGYMSPYYLFKAYITNIIDSDLLFVEVPIYREWMWSSGLGRWT